MELDKKTVKKILLIVTFSVVLFLGLQNIDVVFQYMGIFLGILNPFILGICFAFILNVFLKLIEEKLFGFLNRKNFKVWNKGKRPVCILLSLAVIIGVIFIIIFLIVPELKRTFDIIITNFPRYMEQLKIWVEQLMITFNISADVLANIQTGWDSLVRSITEFLQNGSLNFLNTTVNITTSIFSGVVRMILALVFALYILGQKERLSEQLKRVITAYLPEEKADRMFYIGELSNRVFSNFVSGQLTEATLLGLLCFLGMTIFRMPYASMVAILVGFTALIPLFGAFIGTGIGAFLILMVSPIKAFWFIVFIIVLQQIEGNFIYPKVVGSSVGLPSIWVFSAITLGSRMFGVPGMLISVPLCSVLYCLFREAVRKRIDQKALTTGKR